MITAVLIVIVAWTVDLPLNVSMIITAAACALTIGVWATAIWGMEKLRHLREKSGRGKRGEK